MFGRGFPFCPSLRQPSTFTAVRVMNRPGKKAAGEKERKTVITLKRFFGGGRKAIDWSSPSLSGANISRRRRRSFTDCYTLRLSSDSIGIHCGCEKGSAFPTAVLKRSKIFKKKRHRLLRVSGGGWAAAATARTHEPSKRIIHH